MVCDERLPDAPVPEGIELRVLTTAEEGAAFVAMSDLAYASLGLPAGVIAARGRGLVELVTRAVTNLGFDGGAPFVMLQASPMGAAVYRRMGYRGLCRYANTPASSEPGAYPLERDGDRRPPRHPRRTPARDVGPAPRHVGPAPRHVG